MRRSIEEHSQSVKKLYNMRINMIKCAYCTNNAEITCSCNLSLRLCNVHLVKHLKSKGKHEILLVEDI